MPHLLPIGALAPARRRRARPILGTLVEIAVEAEDAGCIGAALDAAFAEIALVHRLMSFHEAGSDLSRLNRAAPGAPVRVDPRTAEVLHCAEQLRIGSDGAFDCAVAEALIAFGSLPPVPAAEADDLGAPSVGQVTVVRGAAPLDLGGIAKGYAVDRAIDVLRRFDLDFALVNAGGDLRHLGRRAARVHLRDPADSSRLVGSIAIRERALASSATAGFADAGAGGSDRPSMLVDGRRRTPLRAAAGASVAAARCIWADALTKVVLVSGERNHPLLRAHDAEVVLHRAAESALA